MRSAIRAEVRKLFTTRLWWGMAIAVFVVGAAFAAILALVLTSDTVRRGGAAAPLTDGALAKSVFTGGVSIGYLLTLAIGIITIGSEYRHMTITSTFLATPRRSIVMGAKVIALLAIGAFYGLVSLAGSVSIGTVLLTAKGHAPFADAAIWRSLALALLALGLWALIGLGVGILIPNQVAALLIAVGVAWIVEPLLSVFLPLTDWGKTITPYSPGQATSAMIQSGGGIGGPSTSPLAWWVAALVLIGYAVVMAGLGTLRTLRADIS